MKERPILFSAPMVRAVLREENPKTQTRRIINPQPPAGCSTWAGWILDSMNSKDVGKALWHDQPGPLAYKSHRVRCPFGELGDRLWVRETWAHDAESLEACRRSHEDAMGGSYGPYYRATEVYAESLRWRPSIHMPRWASRINLEVTGVRVERLKEISPEDAKAEGLTAITKDGTLVKYGIPDQDGLPGTDNTGWPWSDWDAQPRMAFRNLWAKINGIASWDANPWVWVVEFKRVTT